MNTKKLAEIDQNLGLFPIKDLNTLNFYWKKDLFEMAGVKEERNIEDIASGKRAGDGQEEAYCKKIIQAMEEGKFTSPEEYDRIVSDISDETFGKLL